MSIYTSPRGHAGVSQEAGLFPPAAHGTHLLLGRAVRYPLSLDPLHLRPHQQHRGARSPLCVSIHFAVDVAPVFSSCIL